MGLSSADRRPEAIVVDMDGTLCDVSSIEHLVDRSLSAQRNFYEFHSQSIDCPANPEVLAAVLTSEAAGHAVVIVSAREERWSLLTALWLKEHGVNYADMYLRANGDSRPDSEVKRDIAARLLKKYDVLLALDDREELMPVWNDAGIPVRLVSLGGVLGDLRAPDSK